MKKDRVQGSSGSADPGWLAAEGVIERVSTPSWRRVLRQFADWLRDERRLAGWTIESAIRRAVVVLAAWAGGGEGCEAALRRLDEADVDRLVRRRRAGGAAAKLRWATALFLRFCASRGWHSPSFLDQQQCLRPRAVWSPEAPRRRVAASINRVASSSVRWVLRQYARWLEQERGLAISTIEHRVTASREALAAWLGSQTACVAALRQIGLPQVEALLLQAHDAGRGPTAMRTLRTGVRSLLRFCAEQGWVPAGLPGSIPSTRRFRLGTVPRCATDSDIRALLTALPSSSRPKRDRAMVLLLVSYGVRRAQVAHLRLRDLDWAQRTVTFAAHKGGRTVQHTMTPAVAEAVADYLQHERPECDVEHIFLRGGPPAPRPISPDAIGTTVRRLFGRSGLASKAPGPHALRHAFARRVLAARKPFKTVADLLGHRSLESTAVYAKVDFHRLNEAPLDWPEVLR